MTLLMFFHKFCSIYNRLCANDVIPNVQRNYSDRRKHFAIQTTNARLLYTF